MGLPEIRRIAGLRHPFLKGTILFFLLLSVEIPALLWIYQIAQFGGWAWVCVMSEHHPLARKRMTLAKFLEQDHIKVSISPLDGRYVDSALAKMGKSRRVAVNVPHWLLVPHLLKGSTMISVLSEHLAERAGTGLVRRDLPFASNNFSWSLYWHRRNDVAPAQRWLRAKLTEAAAALTGTEFNPGE